MKNQALYDRLRELFGHVGVYSYGEPVTFQLPADTYCSRSRGGVVRASNISGGERYAVRCPYCHGREKLWLSYVAGAMAIIDGRKVYFGDRWIVCYKCHFDESPEKRKAFWELLKLGEVTVDLKLSEFTEVEDEEIKKVELPEAMPLTHAPDKVLSYVKERGFSPEYLEKQWGVLYSCDDSEFYGLSYLLFPIWQNKVLVGWQARYAGEDYDVYGALRYKTAMAVKKSALLYNADRVRLHKDVVLVEGVFDAFRVGPNRAVALFGKIPSRRQKKLIRDFWHTGKVILMFDSDAFADAEELAMRWNIQGVFAGGAKVAKLPEGKDPAQLTDKEIRLILEAI